MPNTLTTDFCMEAVLEAVTNYGAPNIFSIEQGGPVHLPKKFMGPVRPSVSPHQGCRTSGSVLILKDHTGSTPFSWTVKLRVVSLDAVVPVSVAVGDCESVRCSQRYPLSLRFGCDRVMDSSVPN